MGMLCCKFRKEENEDSEYEVREPSEPSEPSELEEPNGGFLPVHSSLKSIVKNHYPVVKPVIPAPPPPPVAQM